MAHRMPAHPIKTQSNHLALIVIATVLVLTSVSQKVCADNWQKDPISGCAVWTDSNDPGEIVSWSGDCRDGKAEGPGVLVIFKDGQLRGRYAGPMVVGKATGIGTVDYREGDGFLHYEGEVKDYALEGYGNMTYPDGGVYEGQFSKNKADGFGVYTAPDGGVYQGRIKMGEPHGDGYEKTTEGEIYDGDFVDGKRQGEGTLLYANGDRYVGGFSAGLPEGTGSMYLANGGIFQGLFTAGRPDGIGTYRAPGGEIFQGRFVNGDADGILLVTKPDGTQEQQEWKSGKKLD